MLELEVVGTTEVRGRPARAVLPSSSAPRQIWVPQEWTAVQSEEGLRQRGVMEEDGEGEGEIEMALEQSHCGPWPHGMHRPSL
jgi:hypothetical protein